MIAIACDHAGFILKEEIKKYFKNINFYDFGTHSTDSCDYPIFANKLAFSVNNNVFQKGILLCGTANGVNIVANKYPNIRAAICWNIEIAKFAIKHNDANICSLPAKFLNSQEAFKIVETFFNEQFEGGRHYKRISMIPNIIGK